MNRNAVWIALAIVFCWLVVVTLFVVRQAYYVNSHELQLKLQIGMTRSEANKTWGSPGRDIALDSARLPKSMQAFHSGQVACYSRLMPSSYVYVHFSEGGRIDCVYFRRS